MTYILMLDTSVWLDIAGDPFGDELLTEIERLISLRHISILKIDVIDQEFTRHKDDYANNLTTSIRTRIKDLKRYAKEFASTEISKEIELSMKNFERELGPIERAAEKRLARIAELLLHAKPVSVSQETIECTTQRALRKRAPFHSHKNSVADSLIIETFGETADQSTDAGEQFVFLTSNTNDFCDPTDHRKPHPDLTDIFGQNSELSINIANTLKSIVESLEKSIQIAPSSISNEAVKHVERTVEQRRMCPFCGKGVLVDQGWLRTGYGLTWHLRCPDCGNMVDTGNMWD